MKKILRLSPLLVLVVPAIALAATPKTFRELVLSIVDILNTATTVLIAAALVAFLYGAAYNVIKAGERGGTALREFLVWGIIILFVMVSIWGILNLLQQTLFGSAGNRQSSPTGGSSAEEQIDFGAPAGTGSGGSNIRFE